MDYVDNIKWKVKQSRRKRLDEFKHKFRNNKIISTIWRKEERKKYYNQELCYGIKIAMEDRQGALKPIANEHLLYKT